MPSGCKAFHAKRRSSSKQLEYRKFVSAFMKRDRAGSATERLSRAAAAWRARKRGGATMQSHVKSSGRRKQSPKQMAYRRHVVAFVRAHPELSAKESFRAAGAAWRAGEHLG